MVSVGGSVRCALSVLRVAQGELVHVELVGHVVGLSFARGLGKVDGLLV